MSAFRLLLGIDMEIFSDIWSEYSEFYMGEYTYCTRLIFIVFMDVLVCS